MTDQPTSPTTDTRRAQAGPASAGGPAQPGATAYHLRPRSGWLNDPNGMVFHRGRWHVFFQHNPDAPRHERIAWGHASSGDLVTWRDHPVAFAPTPGGPDRDGCWSGVFVPGLDRPAVVYSGVTGPDHRSTVCLRWGRDDASLDDWEAPVVVATTPEVDEVAIMRDPFVFGHGGRRFALLGAGLTDGTPAVLLFGCDDIEAWDYLGVWLTGRDLPPGAEDLPADTWECPQLAVWGGRATLVLSLLHAGVLGPVVGCTGSWSDDGGLPRLTPERLQLLDQGDAYYAPQLAGDAEGDLGPWILGWVRDRDQDPGRIDHAGCMTLPRRLVPDGDGARLVLDPHVRRGLAVESMPPPPDSQLPERARVEVGTGGARLRHPDLGERQLDAGTVVFVDGPVVELYPPTGPPATFRDPVPWSVAGGEVAVSRVLTSSRAAPTDTAAPPVAE